MQAWTSSGGDFTPETPLIARNMGPIWGRQDPGGPHVGPMNFAIWSEIWWHDAHQYSV